MKKIIDCSTGEYIERELLKSEKDQFKIDEELLKTKTEEEKINKQKKEIAISKLVNLGLTEDDLRALGL